MPSIPNVFWSWFLRGGFEKGDAQNPIQNTLSKTTSSIFSAYNRPTGVCLQQ